MNYNSPNLGKLALILIHLFRWKKLEIGNHSFIFSALQLNEDYSMNNPGICETAELNLDRSNNSNEIGLLRSVFESAPSVGDLELLDGCYF